MRLLLVVLLGFGVGALGGVSRVAAQVPRILHYQATLAEGAYPATGPVTIEASFYPDTVSATPVSGWTETWNSVPLDNGRLSLLLGSSVPFPDGFFEQPSLYLELVVEGERLPRIRLASTPYALRSRWAEGVMPDGVTPESIVDSAVGTDALADEAVTARVMADDAVSSGTVVDGAITADKLASAAVTTDALADNAVTNRTLGSSAVDSGVLADGAVRTADLGNASITRQKIAQGTLVTSLNGITDAVTLIGGENVTIRSNATLGTITIAAPDLDPSASQPSSRRWKTDVRPLDGLDLVQQLRGVRYRWKDSGRPDVGVIAEEVGVVLPEVVTYTADGESAESVNYAKLVSVLIEAVKDQQAQIEDARARIQELEQALQPHDPGARMP